MNIITNKNSSWNWPWWIVASILLIVTLIVFKVNSNTWATQILAACLGAIITVIVTRLLLSEQSAVDQKLRSDEEQSKRNLEIYNAKLKVYSEFVSKMYEILSDGKVTKKEFVDLRIQLFGQLSFYANDQILEEIENELFKIKDPILYQEKFPFVFSSITDILRRDLFKDSTEVNKMKTNDSVMSLWSRFENIIKSYPEDVTNREPEQATTASDQLTTEQVSESTHQDTICLNNTFWHFAMWGGEQLDSLSKGDKVYELNLVEYGEEWRTNLMGQVKKDDLIFLFRSGGPGYMGVFLARGWRLFEFGDNDACIETVKIFGEYERQYTNDNVEGKTQIEKDLERSDIYQSRADGATLCSSLIVEPLAFARAGIGNPGGTYRRTISRYDHGYGLMQLARFMAIKDDANNYNVYENKEMGCNKELFEEILASGNIQKAKRDENGNWE